MLFVFFFLFKGKVKFFLKGNSKKESENYSNYNLSTDYIDNLRVVLNRILTLSITYAEFLRLPRT